MSKLGAMGLKYINFRSFYNILFQGTQFENANITTTTIIGPIYTGSTIIDASQRFKIITSNNNQYIIGPNANLYGINLSYQNLNMVDLSGCLFTTSTIIGPFEGTPTRLPDNYKILSVNTNKYIIGPNTNLSGINFYGKDLSGYNLSNCYISTNTTIGPFIGFPIVNTLRIITSSDNDNYLFGPNANFSNININNFDFSTFPIKINGINFTNSDLTGCNFSGCDLSGCNFNNAIFDYTNVMNNLTINGPLASDTQTLNSTSLTLFTIIKDYNQNNYLIGPNANLSGINLKNVNLSYNSNLNLIGVQFSSNTVLGPFIISSILQKNINYNLPLGYQIITNSNNQSYFLGPNTNLKDIILQGSTINNIDLTGVTLGPLLSTTTINNSYSTLNDIFNASGYNVIQCTSNTNIYGYYLVGPGANLDGFNLSNVNLSGINLNNSILNNIIINNNTVIGPLHQNTVSINSSIYNIITSNITYNKVIKWENNPTWTKNNIYYYDVISRNNSKQTKYDYAPNIYNLKYIVGPYANLSMMISQYSSYNSFSPFYNQLFTGVNFSGLNLNYCNFYGLDLSGVNFNNTKLKFANLGHVTFTGFTFLDGYI